MIRRSGLTRSSVFSQKLPDTYKSTDVTDDKSLATLPPSFDIMKKGKPFNINRPQFKMGTPSAIIDESKRGVDISKLNKRSGLGNNTILRDSFRTPDVIGRQPTDYALQEIIDRQQQGIKVQLADKTLQDMFQVKTVDPQDLDWIAEYNRRIASGESKEQLKAFPPFGREQRVMFKRVNFGNGVSLSEASALSMSEEIKLLRDAVTAGSGSSDLVNIMAKVVELTTRIDTFTDENTKMLAQILNKVSAFSPDPTVHFGDRRLWSKTEVENNPLIIPFLFSNVPNADHPLLTSVEPVIQDGKGRIKIKKMLELLAVGTKVPVYDSTGKLAVPVTIAGVVRPYVGYANYLDISTRTVIPRDKAIALVSGSENVDNGMLDGLPPPPILTTGGASVTGKWNTEMEDSASDAASKASTAKMPAPAPKPKPEPKPEPKPPVPSGSEPRSESTKRKGKITKAITDLRDKMIPGATLSVLDDYVDVYSEESPDTFYKRYDINKATKEKVKDGELYKVGDKWYRRGS